MATNAPPSFWVAQIYAVDLLQDLLQEFVPGIRVFIRSLQFKVCVLKPGGPERETSGVSEDPCFRAFSTQDENKVACFFQSWFWCRFWIFFCDFSLTKLALGYLLVLMNWFLMFTPLGSPTQVLSTGAEHRC